MKQSVFEIVSNKPLTDSVFQMVLQGDTTAITAPGQFVNLQLDGLYLRRPISVCDLDGDKLTIVYKAVGKGTEQMSRMHKVMDYYLPTTVKLLTAYKEFDAVSAPGADIISAKGEIEKTIDTINAAFVELLNTLFQNRVFDVTTDAQVLQTMLASEGLTKEMAFDKIEG